MSEAIALYQQLTAELIRVRELNQDLESKEEEDLLDRMDVVWSELSEADKIQLRSELRKASEESSHN